MQFVLLRKHTQVTLDGYLLDTEEKLWALIKRNTPCDVCFLDTTTNPMSYLPSGMTAVARNTGTFRYWQCAYEE